jgi:mRNA-degrading endonuclease RelE of RelBE toxin-antitoxin system
VFYGFWAYRIFSMVGYHRVMCGQSGLKSSYRQRLPHPGSQIQLSFIQAFRSVPYLHLPLDESTTISIIMVMPRESYPYQLIYASRLKDHLRAIDRKYHALIRQAIETQLIFQPTVTTRNRKPLQEPAFFKATWEIRFGPNNRFRVYYDVDEANHEVNILAIGEKKRHKLSFGQEEIET